MREDLGVGLGLGVREQFPKQFPKQFQVWYIDVPEGCASGTYP